MQKGQTPGRLVFQDCSYVLKDGKHKPYYSTNMDTGDYVIVLSSKARSVSEPVVSGTDKEYIRTPCIRVVKNL
jgi:ribosomal protein L13